MVEDTMAKAQWDNVQVLEALRSREPDVTQPSPTLQLLDQIRKLERWELEMILDFVQEQLDS
jgi:hypothetical protein